MTDRIGRKLPCLALIAASTLYCMAQSSRALAQIQAATQNSPLTISVENRGANFRVQARAIHGILFQARVGARVDHRWLWSTDYPNRSVRDAEIETPLGPAHQTTVTLTGAADRPELTYTLESYPQRNIGSVQVALHNTGSSPITVQDIRVIDINSGSPAVNLAGPEGTERVLSDSYSEDRPPLTIFDLGKAHKYLGGDAFGNKLTPIHFAVGSQLLYNRSSRYSLLVAAQSSNQWLTTLHLHTETGPDGSAKVSSYAVDSTGTTDILKKESLLNDPPEDQIELSLSVAPGAAISSEKVMFSVSRDYHNQLESYGQAIKKLRHALVSKPAPWGWWSWTAYFFGLNHGTALTNARWLSENLRSYGFDYFHIDEGYAYANGEYTTPDASRYPSGIRKLGYKITNLGLHFGIWTAPFRVSQRAWVYQHHPDWLVHNAQGKPIQIGYDSGSRDPIYVLDTTNPGAQQYLRQTYHTLVREWDIRYIKLDFMDDTAIEGYRYQPNTTAIAALQTGLGIIRDAVGPDVLLDKDGSPMLPAVGYTDLGRLSTDTGHSFEGAREDATGIAARYYMNGNFYRSDPDAFSISKQLITDQSWHESKEPLSLNEAEATITLAAVAGGMMEIGDDLPTLGADPDRLKLVTNHDLLNMVRLGRAATPVDLMTYRPQDTQPSIFFLREDARQGMLAIFNWTGQPQSRDFALSRIGYTATQPIEGTDVFHPDRKTAISDGVLHISGQEPHSVRLIKLIDTAIPAAPPSIALAVPARIELGKNILFEAKVDPEGPPAIRYLWNFGDGVTQQGAKVHHAYTRNGDFTVTLTATGVDGEQSVSKADVTATGAISTVNTISSKIRYKEAE